MNTSDAVEQVVAQLKSLGLDSYRNTMLKHGAQEPIFGVKIEEMKKLMKPYKGDLAFAYALFDTGIYDAQYMAGLLADGSKMTEVQLQHWVEVANSHGIREYSVAWVTAESSFAMPLALAWIDSSNAEIAAAGWSTLSSYLSVIDHAKVDLKVFSKLLRRVQTQIHQAPNRVRYCMNGFVIALGSYVPDLTEAAIVAGQEMGQISVDMGGTSCKVPFAPDYIGKVVERGNLGKKRKTSKC
ncbi:DNA alkylation repair protein [Undibacterium baiyunense]|uniref:DNA alkylation repair protein n=1 Tax=Undibacterium baiyunense TaxID=2828731 RepID=A0A941DBR0_9BURK|nr:DNA alkylation repair protein [Undibacterium baiyunense]MBR7745768.1 DNA alkylation repair protein [Undibacterium baiyunense]